MVGAPDKSAQQIRFLIAILGVALAVFAWYRYGGG